MIWICNTLGWFWCPVSTSSVQNTVRRSQSGPGTVHFSWWRPGILDLDLQWNVRLDPDPPEKNAFAKPWFLWVLPRSSCLMILVRTAEPIFFLGLVVSNSSPSTLSTYSNKNKKVKQWRNKREKIMKIFMQLSMNQEKKTRKGINILIWDFSLSV